MTRVVILSVPYLEPYPAVAPILLSACLNKNSISAVGIDFNIKLLDNFANCAWWPSFKNMLCNGYLHSEKLPRRALLDILKFTRKFLLDIKQKHNPEYIGLSVFTSESLDFSLVLSYLIRRYLPDCKIIAGGKGLEVSVSSENSTKHYDVFVNSAIADLVIVGDAEHEIVTAIKNSKSGLIIADQLSAEDLDNIPLSQWSDYDLQIYSKLSNFRDQEQKYDEPHYFITASKGCVRSCSFCDVASFWPKFIHRNPEKVANEILSLWRNTGVKKFRFTDNLINGSVSNYRKINEILARDAPRQLDYGGYAIFRGKNQMPVEDFELAARAGCTMWSIGVESGSEKIRYDMGKKFTDDDLDWSVNLLHKVGITQSWLVMVGYPSETDEDFELTLDMFKKYAHLNKNGMITYGLTPTFALLDNSPIMNNPVLLKKYGLGHNISKPNYQKFWTSSVNPSNTFPVRLDRWRKLVQLCEDLKYQKQGGFPIDKWQKELNSLEKLYYENQ